MCTELKIICYCCSEHINVEKLKKCRDFKMKHHKLKTQIRESYNRCKNCQRHASSIYDVCSFNRVVEQEFETEMRDEVNCCLIL